MSTEAKNARKILAGFVSVAGVVAIWALSAARQQDQTVAISRQWVGEQWDVARTCLVGTPIGRGESPEAIAAQLDAKLVDTLVALADAEEPPDRAVTWPTRCVSLLPSLRVDASLLRGDPGSALAELEVLVPRVIPADAEAGVELSVATARERLRELAEPIARLDAAMPSGADYDVARFARPDLGAPPEVALDSLECPPPTRAQRPFLDARIGDEALFDELEVEDRSLRLSGTAGGAFQLASAGSGGTELRPVSRPDAQHPLLWDESTLLWVLADSAQLALRALGAEADEARVTVDEGAPFERVALCRADATGHLVTQRGEELSWVRWAGPGERATRPVPLPRRPPEHGVLVACDDDRLALVWQEGETWTGLLCAAEACEPVPPFVGRGDVQIAVSGELLAVGRGRWSALPVARTLARETELAWTEPVVAARGRLTVSEGAYGLDLCEGAHLESADGRRWTR